MAERAPRQPRKATLTAVPGGASSRSRTRKPAADPLAAPAPPDVSTVKGAAEHGTDRDLLIALRNRLAGDIDDPDTPPRDRAALTRRLQEITKDLKGLDARQGRAGAGAAVPDESFDASAI